LTVRDAFVRDGRDAFTSFTGFTTFSDFVARVELATRVSTRRVLATASDWNDAGLKPYRSGLLPTRAEAMSFGT